MSPRDLGVDLFGAPPKTLPEPPETPPEAPARAPEASTTALVAHVERAPSPTERAQLATVEAARQAAHKALGGKPHRQSTDRLYERRWAAWERWCRLLARPAAPTTGEVVATYLFSLRQEGKGVSSVELALAAVLDGLRRRGHAEPVRADRFIHGALETIRHAEREAGTVVKKKKALTIDDLRRIVPHLRNADERAIVLVGFWGAMRRAEITAIRADGVSFDDVGASFRTPTKDRWETRMLPALDETPELCPVRALRAALDAHPLGEGRLFLNRKGRRLGAKEVNRIVKRAVKKAGLDEALYGAHSLRSGFMTTGGRAQMNTRILMTQSKHRSERIAGDYIQEDAWKGNAALELARRLGLSKR